MKETSEYGARLKALKEEQQRIERKQTELLEKRRAELGRLAEKVGVLEADDDAIAGALLELKSAIENPAGDGRLKQWRAAGASFRGKDKDRKAAAPHANGATGGSNSDAAGS
jgi:Conjugal transfer protein TraD